MTESKSFAPLRDGPAATARSRGSWSSFRLPALLIFGLALALPALSQSYGPNEQVLVVGADEFRPTFGANTAWSFGPDDGYLYGGSYYYFAPVHLPDGARVTGMCLYANQPDDVSSVSVKLEAIKLAAAGQLLGFFDVPGSSVASQATGVGAWCTGSLSYTVHSTADVDGNGVENLAHRLAAIVNNGGGLGAVRIFWVRQVSDPPATPTFGDVPATDGGYPFIEALSASGITVGCAGGNFCPDAPLTRRQMAVFLAKALGLHWPN